MLKSWCFSSVARCAHCKTQDSFLAHYVVTLMHCNDLTTIGGASDFVSLYLSVLFVFCISPITL